MRRPPTIALCAVAFIVGAIVGLNVGRLVGPFQEEPAREEATVVETAPVATPADPVRGLLAEWIDEAGGRGTYEPATGLLKSSSGLVWASLKPEDRDGLKERNEESSGVWRFDSWSAANLYLATVSDGQEGTLGMAKLYELKDGALRELYAVSCAGGSCPAWYILGKRGPELVIWATGFDNSPGPCFSPWLDTLVSLDTGNPSAGFKPFRIPAYKAALEERETEACAKAISSP
jgi:hypothetical protein